MPPQARRTSPNYLLEKVIGAWLRARSHVRVAVLLSQALIDEKPQLLSTFDPIYEALGIESDEELPFKKTTSLA